MAARQSSRDIQQRFWYYGHVTADPVDPDTVNFMKTSILQVDGRRPIAGTR